MARTQGNIYKALHTAMKRYEKYKPEKERDNWQGRNQDSYLGGPKLKTEKKIMKIKTNIYFIFNKILHTK